MNRNIKVKISTREYNITVRSDEEEQFVRSAADEVTLKEQAYMSSFPGRSLVDILSFVALNAFVGTLRYRKLVDDIAHEAHDLDEQTKSYLDSLDEL